MMPSINTNTPPTGTNAASGTTPSTTTPSDSTDALANKTTFLQLLVAQIQNQDPTQPQDGIQFISQLAQFSQLEQSIDTNTTLGSMSTDLGSVNTELGSIQGLLTNAVTPPATTPAAGSTTSTQ
jgi:flagellar basal-body rod modification protein FlgD